MAVHNHPREEPPPPVDHGLADRLDLGAGNSIEVDDGHDAPHCVLQLHDACEDIQEEPVTAFAAIDARALRRIGRWLLAWADELEDRAREAR